MNTPAITQAENRPPASSSIDRTTREGWLFEAACRAAAWSSFAFLTIILGTIFFEARGALSLRFLTSFDSADPARAGILAGLWGSFWMILLTGAISVPLGVGAAIFLEEYASDTWIVRVIRTNLANLAGVPSVVYGLLGLAAFVRAFGLFDKGGGVERLTGLDVEAIVIAGIEINLPFGRSIFSGALTLALLLLPTIIVASQEALRAVPSSIRHAALALGATRWQTISGQVVPTALPGMVTGIILALSRAIGETAPLIVAGAFTYVAYAPGGIDSPAKLVTDPAGILKAPFDTYTVIPLQVYSWIEKPQTAFHQLASAGIVVLLSLLLVMNGVAVYIRYRSQRHLKW
ncbi:MAG TPA: PstA family ABC transporter permease [Caulifigura sp.]|nr:PstA family ABC transporter permease [Caulifigura sp.]